MKSLGNADRTRQIFGAAIISAISLGLSSCAHHSPLRNTASLSADPNPKSVAVKLETPTSQACHSLSYRNLRQTLKPGEAMEFGVPRGLQSKAIAFVTLGHAQMSSYGDRDSTPGLTSVQFRSSQDGKWKYWGGPSSGEAGSKFAEYRGGSFELEGLYEWGHYGYFDLDSRAQSNDPLPIDRIRAVSSGDDSVVVDEVSVVFWPSSVKVMKEEIFTPGTRFGDYVSTQGASYSLDHSTAREIGYSSPLSIPLEAGKKLSSVEVACGDASPSSSNPGGGALTFRLVHADGTADVWKDSENAPPAGILKAATPVCDYKTVEGDRLEISGGGDRVWVMGVRLGFN